MSDPYRRNMTFDNLAEAHLEDLNWSGDRLALVQEEMTVEWTTILRAYRQMDGNIDTKSTVNNEASSCQACIY